ncbi:MAG TPA: phosphate ABC transporter permease PstA [Acetomicrobium hydrogeniformans]|uniref:Phosphate transport system permease protein PstA n=2 Tax=Acetomicrobium hydrogeniformans TaxID=649746 RepID=A0A7V6ZEW1_9BACT|nr:phosphate ABC transporter permease PstA [Acetomicrobium hydrogeniformans]
MEVAIALMGRKLKDKSLTFILWASMFAVILILFGILGFVIVQGAGALSIEFLTQPPRNSMTEGGILTPIVGTIQLILVSIAFSLPVGICTAIYLAEYAKDDIFTTTLRLAIRSLAGVPSIVYGLFGLSFFCITLKFNPSLLSAGLTLGCIALPLIVGAAETALLAVPQSLRYASYALGASKWQTISKVVVPTAMPSILTGAILSVGRVAGETAPIMFTGAAFFTPGIAKSLFQEVMALPFHVYVLATAGTSIDKTRPLQYGAILVLLILVLGITLVGIIMRARLSRRRYLM